MQWPPVLLSPAQSPNPATELASMPIPPSRSSPRNKNPDHIPRPRNAFMLFRSAFAAAQKVSTNVEHDNRHITRIIAHCWHRLSNDEKQVWRDKATAEKAQHQARYPNYRFTPTGRRNKPVKRKVRRNGAGDVKRCETLAELVMSGKRGTELESAIKQFDDAQVAAERGPDALETAVAHPAAGDVPPFLSPLLPPAQAAMPLAPDLSAEPVVRITVPAPVEPQTVCPFVDTGSLDPELASLFAAPSYQYYQPYGDDVPRSIDPYRRVMDFVQNTHAQLEQDLSLFSWDLPGNFSFHA